MRINRGRGLAAALFLCSGLAAQSGAALPLISEVFYDAAGSDNGLSFVELYGAPGASVDGFLLEGVNGSNGAITPSVTLSGVIPADGLLVVADDQGDGTSLVANADLILNFDFQNGYQTQAKSVAYAVSLRRIGPGCATAQSCVCQ